MNDYAVIARRHSIWTSILIVLFVLAAFLTGQTTFFNGLALGAFFSLLNMLSTYSQVKRTGEAAVQGEPGRLKKTGCSFGTVTRIAFAVAAVYIAVTFPMLFDVRGVIIGLLITYIMILIEPLFHIKRL
ncbi:ATP synthase subunit I [Evansella clarkii]|jgi:ATP synthase protein I|uniref:ATP synthase subunit I n=1 Tax=Evansella clarkii TaxID=79879 RepID=UPI000997EB4D|nr:ATP synthase subunit I [Evansella clarkii]